ncbi:hypothetical protein [Marinobacter salarius]|uniref:hypothetical protein n=1 Tax=Marinobacter salarius TaxID=1420917 RepID=UPI0025A39FF7|nr:hypothetical protein [Marinobacter salarius]MDM8181286.1 hypothetical protein [Marinobacter salarius]|tara:strand:- start:2488 stop:2775 length:288 start_codon:yes stop_codon:yes gene_type:complete
MANRDEKSVYEEGMRDLPPMARAAIDQLREITNAQTDFIAHLLIALERSSALSDAQIRSMLSRWHRSYDPAPQFDEHGQLADSIESVRDGLRALE